MSDDATSGRDPASDEADALRVLRDSAPPLDRDAIWVRVRAGVAATPQRGWPRWDPRGWAWRPQRAQGGAWRLATLPAAAAAAMIAIVVGAALLAGRGDASAAVIEDVERLSGIASTALADDELSAGELAEIERLTTTLAQTIALEPDALSALNDAEIGRLIIAVDSIRDGITGQHPDATETVPLVGLIEAVAEQARTVAAAAVTAMATAPPSNAPGEEAVTPIARLPVCAGAEGTVASRCDRTFRAAVVTCQEAADRDVLESCEEAVDAAEDACSDLPAKGQRKACERELKDLERAAESRLDGNDHDEDDDDRRNDEDHDEDDDD